MFKLGKLNRRSLLDYITLIGVIIGVLALFALIFYQVRPVQLADIKVPVATDKSSYYPGQAIGGIFLGETFYDGNVKILREVFCTDYKGIIKPPAEAADGNFFDTIAKPREFNGNTIPIGHLPDNIPLGVNCVVRFTNVYNMQTPFGVRHEEYQYYTQNFAIISKERRDQLDCEATGKTTEQCQKTSEKKSDKPTPVKSEDNTFGGGVFNGGGSNAAPESGDRTTTNNTDNSTTIINPPTPAEPVAPPEPVCTVDLLGIKLLCQ